MGTFIVRTILVALWLGFLVILFAAISEPARKYREEWRETQEWQKFVNKIEEYRNEFS